jgi:hypothetical protein
MQPRFIGTDVVALQPIVGEFSHDGDAVPVVAEITLPSPGAVPPGRSRS